MSRIHYLILSSISGLILCASVALAANAGSPHAFPAHERVTSRVNANFNALATAIDSSAAGKASSRSSVVDIASSPTATLVYVDVSTGNDNNAGTINSPLASITAALGHVAAGDAILVSKGVYAEQVVVTLPVSVYGQYDQSRGWIREAANVTTINSVAVGQAGSVVFSGVSRAALLDGFEVHAANAAPFGSSYAVRIIDSPGPVLITHNILTTGTGGFGQAGIAGTNGAPGGGGGIGQAGNCDNQVTASGGFGGTSACGRTGGSGGLGGYSQASGTSGAASTSGVFGGTGGISGDPGNQGGAANSGIAGGSGSNALPSSNVIGATAAPLYVPVVTPAANAGVAGQGGGGGGGGGGQHCFFCSDGTGNGGGGGGAGGCGGTAGTSGTGGGGTFAIFVNNATANVDANYIVTNAAGTGGIGGNGSMGGQQGALGLGGNICTGEVGRGGSGGNGGPGGAGGAGAGGPGGPAVGVFATTSASVTLGTNRYSLPGQTTGGTGGSSPSGPAGNGLAGTVRRAYPSNVSEPAPAALDAHDASILMPYTGIAFVAIPITLAPITHQSVHVHFQTVDGTAIAGTHYVAASGDLVFEPWTTQQTIRLQVLGQPDPDKSFSVQLTAPMNAVLNVPNSNITIDYDVDVIFRNGFD